MDRSVRRRTVANESVIEIRVDRTFMLFASGPRLASCPPVERLLRVRDALTHAVAGIRWGEQVHGRIVASLAAEPGDGLDGVSCVGRCDALITAEPRLGLAVWTADCVPILFSGDDVIAGVHAGWRGAAVDIVGAVVRRFAIEYGVAPDRLHAVLGPAISGQRYEVGAEVIADLKRLEVDETRWRSGRHIDLRGLLAGRLETLGLDPRRIRIEGPCTASNPELASFRRDGEEAGRQWSMVYREG